MNTGTKLVTQISGTKRLAMGLGIMALGVLGALPFRHAPPPEMTAATAVAQSQTTLGEGVSLQVPGQIAIAGLQTPDLQPLPVDDEPNEPAVEPSPERETVITSPPPRLPDQYQPLFQPDPAGQTGAGRVVSLSTESTPAPQSPKQHTIHDGDTLESLALRYLGDSNRADELLEANRALLTDPQVLPIGVQITIPAGTSAASQPALVGSEVPTRNLVPLPAIGFRRSR